MKEAIDVVVIKNSWGVVGTKVIEDGCVCSSHINSVAQ